MKTINIQIPDSLVLDDDELQFMMVAALYRDKRISLGQASELTGMKIETLIELFNKKGISIFTDSVSDLHADFENA
jgi:predicted HTH domain antitoxin